jgi:hypothetical protein
VTGPDGLIADAMRELAEQAAPPRQAAAAAWRAGRRRRVIAMAASAATAAAVAAAVALPLAAGSAPTHSRHEHGAVPITLASPIQFRQVATIGRAPCPAHSGGLLGGTPPSCFHLTGTGVTVTRVESLSVTKTPAGMCSPEGDKYTLSFFLIPADAAGPFAALTGKLVLLPAPRNQLAVVINGRVVAHPTVQGAIHQEVQIFCLASRAQAEQLLRSLLRG